MILSRAQHLRCCKKALTIAVETDTIAIAAIKRIDADHPTSILSQELRDFSDSLRIIDKEIAECPTT